MFYFHPIHKNVGNLSKIGVYTSNCCLKSGPENNWMKKLDRVNRPLDQKSRQCLIFPRSILQSTFAKWPPLLDLAAAKWA